MLWAGLSISAVAETVYVSDNLRVGVRPEPDNGYTPVGVVTTGMKLNVLDRQSGYLKIETSEGVTGWIKDIYVIDEKPAILKLQQLQKRYDKMSAQLKDSQKTLQALESANRNLNQQVDNLKQERSELQLMQAKSISNQQQARKTWYWWLVALAVVISGGFIGGIQWYRHQAMKRLGGIRV
jgi:SH3 domain protein